MHYLERIPVYQLEESIKLQIYLKLLVSILTIPSLIMGRKYCLVMQLSARVKYLRVISEKYLMKLAGMLTEHHQLPLES